MRKFGKSLIAFLVVLTFAFPFAGCNKYIGEDIDESRTQLYVGNHKAGLGDQWINAVKERFEKAYADTQFEQGKRGVQVFIDNTAHIGTSYLEQYPLASDSNQVYFTESFMYYDFVSRNLLADMTDVVTDKLEEFDEERSIEDKMSADVRDFYKTDDGKYYAIPFFEAYSSIAYDIDLFEKKQFYFAKGGCPSEYSEFTQEHNEDKVAGAFSSYKYVGEVGTRSAGPDGLYNTDDDGLPATYDEFFVLCERMEDRGVRPMIWPGKFPDYLNETATMLWADFEGKDKASVRYTMTGNDVDIVTSFDGSDPVVTPTNIRNKNAYLMYNQEGRYYALDFLHRLISGNYYHSDAFEPTTTQSKSQEDFLYGTVGLKDSIAMIADGSWWQNEADDIFSTLIDNSDKTSKKSWRIGLMPLPKASEKKIGEPQTYLSTKKTGVFINKNCTGASLELAKLFVKFCHTDESLKEFMSIVNMPKPYDFTMTETEQESLTSYGKDLYKAHKTGNVVFTESKNPIYRASASNFMATAGWETVLPSGLPASIISETFKNYKDFTARNYFDGLIEGEHTKTEWTSDYGQYFSYNAD